MRRSHARSIPACLGLLVLLAAPPAFAQSLSSLVEKGNQLYAEGRLAEALKIYRRAESQAPGSAALHYNIGNVLYRQGEYDQAYDEYRQAFAAKERELAEGARFNAGNSHFARKNWREAIRNYQEALRLNPGDIDAKRNLELALLQMQEDEKKRQQQQQEQPQEDQQDEQQDQQNQDPKQEDRTPQDAPRPQPREQRSMGEVKNRVSRDEAMRILDAMREQDRPPKDQLKVPPPDRRPERDW